MNGRVEKIEGDRQMRVLVVKLADGSTIRVGTTNSNYLVGSRVVWDGTTLRGV